GVPAAAPPKPSRTDLYLKAFRDHLCDTRGYAPRTVEYQVLLAGEFLAWLHFEKAPQQLSALSSEAIDRFIRRLSKRMGRVTLQKAIAILRNFLRFLATGDLVAPGLDTQIDTPRIYRQEQLPQALPWPTVQAFLRSINREVAMGKRDY